MILGMRVDVSIFMRIRTDYQALLNITWDLLRSRRLELDGYRFTVKTFIKILKFGKIGCFLIYLSCRSPEKGFE